MQPLEFNETNFPCYSLAIVSCKNTVKHLGAWYPYKLLATSTRLVVSWCGDVAKVSFAMGCLHEASFSLRIGALHLLYSINIKSIASHLFSADQFSVKTAWCWGRSTELEPENLLLPEYTVWFLIWETGLRTYLYHFSSKAFCKDDLITSCTVIWKWKILSCLELERVFIPFWGRNTVPWVGFFFVVVVVLTDFTFQILM